MWLWIGQAGHGLPGPQDVNISFSQTATECSGLIDAGCSNFDRYKAVSRVAMSEEKVYVLDNSAGIRILMDY